LWYYNNQLVDDESIDSKYIGFVYRITNLTNGKMYIGKKLLTNTRSKKVKGKTRKKRTKVESNWKSYFGSNKLLLDDVQLLGEDKFKREILMFCLSKGTLNYMEMKYQIDERVLESDQYYNDWIFVKVHRSHLKLH
jgi:Putative endonuclease segE, GIY-YIG domain